MHCIQLVVLTQQALRRRQLKGAANTYLTEIRSGPMGFRMTATIPFGTGLGITFATPIEGQKVH
jgi:hypothetical protein